MKSEKLKEIVLKSLEDMKAQDINVLDVKERTSVTEYMIVASGTSSRHIKSIADNVVGDVKEKGILPLGIEGGTGSDWVLVDLGDIVVHVMMHSAREFYDLERFWTETPNADGLIN
jgi:ribosome-associated protein